MKRLVAALVVMLAVLVSLNYVFACGSCGSGKVLSVEKIKGAMDEYVQEDVGLKGGYFLIYDSQAKKVLQLNYEGLHEKVKLIKEEEAYYACADFRTLDGATLYDIDFWVKKGSHGKLKVEKVIVHKENGKAKFSYKGYTLLPFSAEALSPEAGSHDKSRKHQHEAPEAGSQGSPEAHSW